MSDRRSSLITAALSNWLPMGANVLTGFLLTPFVLGHVGKNGYGIWSLALSFVGYYSLMQLAISAGTMRYVPFYTGRKNNEAASQIMSSGLAMLTIVGLSILLISTFIAEPLSRFYHGGRQLAALIRITGFAAAIEPPMKIFDAGLRAKEKWVTANVITTASGLMYALGLVICLFLGFGLIGMGFAIIVSNSITLAVRLLTFRRLCPEIHLDIGLARWSGVRDLLSFGILTTIGTGVLSLAFQNHKLIIGKLVSLEAVAFYAVAAQLMDKVRGIVWAPLQVAFPRFALLDGQNDYQNTKDLFNTTTRYSGILASGAVLLVLVGGPPFIRLWLGRGFEPAYSVLVILGIGGLVESTLYGVICFLSGTNRQGMLAIFSCIEAVGGFGMSILLGWKMGLVGVAWGFTIFVILIRGLARTWYVCRLLKISLIDYCMRTLLLPWSIMGAIAITGFTLRLQTHVVSWFSWLVLLFIVTTLYCLLTCLFVLNLQERKLVFEKARFMLARGQILLAVRKRAA